MLRTVVGGLLLAVVAWHGPSATQAATLLGSQGTPSAAAVGACDVAPRTLDELLAIAGTEPGSFVSAILGTPTVTPELPVGGAPADEAVVDAVAATVQAQFACINAGDLLRVASFWSDEFIQQGLGGVAEENLAFLTTPTPLPAVDRSTLVSIMDVRRLGDDRVTAVVTTTNETALSIFVESEGRYLLDDSIVLSRGGTPTP